MLDYLTLFLSEHCSEASVADRPSLVFDTKAILGSGDDKETCPRYSPTLNKTFDHLCYIFGWF